MSARRRTARLLRLYPSDWRARYGDELESLILETSGGRVPWGTRIDVARSAGRERLACAGLTGDRQPADRMRGATLLVLCAWAVFVVAGLTVQRLAEHWPDATPAAERDVPGAAFDTLVAVAGIGSVLVIAGVVAALPAARRFLRAGRWGEVRRHLLAAALLTCAAALATAGVVAWTSHDTASSTGALDVAIGAAYAVVIVACIAGWTVAGVATARRLELSRSVLRLQSLLAAGIAASMAVMTAATVVWWIAVAEAAPWFLTGAPPGAAATPLAPAPLMATALMALASAAGIAGAARAVGGALAAGD